MSSKTHFWKIIPWKCDCKAHMRAAALYAVQGMQEMLLKEECTQMIKHPETAVNNFLKFLKVCIPSLAYPCV